MQLSTRVRQPAFAGSFYPNLGLREQVAAYLIKPNHGLLPKAIIVPHAGYVYSGAIAGSAYGYLLAQNFSIRKVVILGPSHRIPFAGLALSSAQAFATPLGQIELDHEGDEALLKLNTVQMLDLAHEDEHSIEVQLPFLQVSLRDFAIVPIVVGFDSASAIANALEILWDETNTLIVVSSDLSHYLPYQKATQCDRKTATAIEQLNSAAIKEDDACGRLPILGLLEFARRKRLKPQLIDLRNSGDTAGDKSKVVGYGSFIFT